MGRAVPDRLRITYWKFFLLQVVRGLNWQRVCSPGSSKR